MKRFVSAILVVAIAASPAAADTRYYYRDVTTSFPSTLGGTGASTSPGTGGTGTDSGSPPSAGTNNPGSTNPSPGQNAQVVYSSAQYAPVAGTPFAVNLPVPAGVNVTAWRAASPTLPNNLTLDGTYGILEGTPTDGGASSFVLYGYDSSSRNTLALNVTVTVDAAPVPTSTQSASGRQSIPFQSFALTAPAGTSVSSWRLKAGNALPAGLGLTNGAVTGTPTTSGVTKGVIFEGLDGTGAVAARAALDVNLAGVPSIATVRNKVVAATDPLYVAPQATNALAPVQWSLSGNLPAGLSFDPNTGAISGQVLQNGVNATLTVSLRDKDSLTATSNPFVVGTATVFTGINAIPDMSAGVGSSFAVTFSSSNLNGTVAWSTDSSSQGLPPGLTMDAYGTLSGVPSKSGTYPGIVLKAIAMADGTVSRSNAFSIVVRDPPSLAPVANLSLRTGKPVQASVPATPTDRSYTYALSGTLPPGVSINQRTGAITGTPTATGLYSNLLVTVTDNYGLTASSNAFQAEVAQGLLATYPSPTPDFRQGRSNAYVPTPANAVGAVTYTVTATGNDQSCGYNWYYGQWTQVTYTGYGSCYSGSLPAGLSMDAATGALSGIPASTPRWWAQVTARDADGSAVTVPLSGTIRPRHTLSYAASTATAPNATVTIAPSLSNAIGPVTYAVTPGSGSLPTGVTLKSDGTISGSPTANGTSLFTVDATDSDNLVSTSNQVRIAVSNQPDIFVASVPAGKVGRPFSMTATAGNLVGAATWTTPTGLPAGLAFNAGTITGTPTTVGNSTFSLSVKDSRNVTTTVGPYTVTVAAGNVITVTPPAKWRQGLSSTAALSIGNAVGAVTWSATGLPAGVTLSQSGALTGAPGAPGNYAIALTATDSEGTVATAAYPITVEGGIGLTYGSSKSYYPNDTVSILPSASGLQGAPRYEVASGALIPGLVLNADGSITGQAPQAAAPTSVTVRMYDTDGSSTTASLVVAVSASDFVVSVATAPSGQAYQALTLQPYALLRTQSLQQYVAWSLVGTLPNGLSFDSISGAVTGTPTGPSTTTLRFRAVYADKQATSDAVTLTIADRTNLVVAFPDPAVSGRTNAPLTITPTSSGSMGSLTWTVLSGVLPQGLTVSPSTGVISGSPAKAGSYSIQLQAADASRKAQTGTLTLTVATAMTATASVQTTGNRVGKGYLANLNPTGNSGAVTWSQVAGVMPAGLALDPVNGTVSGIPQADATTSVTLRATDATAAYADVALNIVVGKGPAIATVPALNAAVNQPFQYVPSASTTVGTLAWDWDAGVTPPAGIGINPGTGAISGSPTAAGTNNALRIKVTDGDNLTAVSNAFVLTASTSTSIQVAVPANVSMVRGQPVSITPVVTGAQGTVTYKLQVYGNNYYYNANSCGYQENYAWRDYGYAGAGLTSRYCTSVTPNYALPDGLSFNASTGVISGTPTSPTLTPANNTTFVPQAYRVVATETRTGGASATSGQIVFSQTDWPPATIQMPASAALVRGQPTTLTPVVFGVQGTVTYKLQAYGNNNYFNANSCGYVEGYAWRDRGYPGTGQTSQYCSNASPNYNLPNGLSIDAATGIISGTATSATTLPTGAAYQPTAYRVVMTETRQGQTLTSYSGEITFTANDWAQGTVSIPPAVRVVRGQPLNITPIVAGVQGTVTYKLQAFGDNYYYNANSCTSYREGFNWRDKGYAGTGQTSQYCTSVVPNYNLPDGLSFDTTTGIISGTPNSQTLTPAGDTTFVPTAYRIVATETRQGQTLSYVSNQVAFTFQDWPQPTLSVNETVAMTRGVPVRVEPTVSNLFGTVTYKLQAYGDNYYYNANSCTSYREGYGWRDKGYGGAGSTTQYCTSVAANYNLPDGLSFDTATGIISGTPTSPTLTPANDTTFPPQAYRIVATETRQGQTNTAVSNQIVFTQTDWAPATISIPTDYDLVQGKLATLNPITSGIQGTVTYKLQVYGNNNYFNANSCGYVEGYGWRDYGYAGYGQTSRYCNSASPNYYLPDGMGFNTTTGVISGTPTTSRTLPTNAAYQPIAYRVVMTETRQGQTLTWTSNQVVFRALATSPTGPTLDYGGPLAARIGDSVSFKPTLSGTTSATSYALTFSTTANTGTSDRYTGALPTGLGFNLSTGEISGTIQPGSVTNNVSQNTGTYRGYKVCAMPGSSPCDAEIAFNVAERDLPTLAVAPYPTGTVGTMFSLPPQVGGTTSGALAFTLNVGQGTGIDDPNGERRLSTPPSGMGLSSQGVLSGVPSAAGTFRGYTLTVKDAQGYTATTREIVISIAPTTPLAVTMQPVVEAVVAQQLTPVMPTVQYPVGPVTFTLQTGKTTAQGSTGNEMVLGTLPPGLSLGTDGSIYGTPTAAAAGLAYRGYKVCANDSRNVANPPCTDEITIRVSPSPGLTLTASQVSVSTTQDVSMTQVAATPANVLGTFSYASALTFNSPQGVDNVNGERFLTTLPAGLSYDATKGVIYGAPSASPGRYRGYRICGTDSGRTGTVCTAEIVIDVAARATFAVTMPTVIDAKVGQPLALVTPGLSGQSGAVTFNAAVSAQTSPNVGPDIVQAALPAGITYDPATGGLSAGTKVTASAGRYRGYQVCAKDALARSACSAEIVISVTQ